MNISRYFIPARNLIFPALRSRYSFVHLGVFKIIQPIEHCLYCRFVANCCRRSFHSHLYYTRYQLVTDRSVFLSFSLSLSFFFKLYLSRYFVSSAFNETRSHLTGEQSALWISYARVSPLSDNQTQRATNRFSWYLISIAAPVEERSREQNEERFIRSVPIFSLARNHHGVPRWDGRLHACPLPSSTCCQLNFN